MEGVELYAMMGTERHVVAFWDESVVPAVHCSGFDAARFVCRAAATVGAVKSLKYYVDVKGERRGALPSLRSELKNAGVTVVDTASSGRECSAAKMLITDALIYAIDNPAPSSLLLVSADPDICYGTSLLRMRGYQVYLLCPPDSGPDFEEFQLPVDFDTSDFLEVAPRPPFGDDGSLGRPRSRSASAPRSSDSSKPPRGPPVHDGQTNGLHTHVMEAPSLLPSSEIDAFRQRFNNSRPNLDTAGTNPFKPHRHSFSSFGRNGPSDPQGPQGVPSLRDLGRHLNVDPKGKGRAVDSDSMMMVDSPIILTATSMSGSRSNSFGSVYREQPSTAPTSAMPWYRPDFKMGADGVIKEGGEGTMKMGGEGTLKMGGEGTMKMGGEGKYEGLLESMGQGIAAGSVTRSQKAGEGSADLDGDGEVTPIRVARSVSGSTGGSATPTATAGPTIGRPATSSEVNIETTISSRSELPQKIQVHASPPAAIAPAASARPPAVAEASSSNPSMWTSRWTPSARRDGTGGSAAASTIPDTDPLRGPYHAASSVARPPSAANATQTRGLRTLILPAAQLMAGTPSTLPPATRPESRMSAGRTAGAMEEPATPTAPAVQLQSTEAVNPFLSSVSTASRESSRSPTSKDLPVASTSSQSAVSPSSSTSSASSPDPTIQGFPGVPPHFNILIEVLREHSQKGANSADRNTLSSQLYGRQRNVLIAAGTARLSKPFVRYYNAAFQAGIITSATGRVALTEQYRGQST